MRGLLIGGFVALVLAGPASAAPTVELLQPQVPKGGLVTIKGTDWAPGAAVGFRLRGPAGSRMDVGQTVVYEDGTWRFAYEVRDRMERGRWRIIARQSQDDGQVVRRVRTFTVVRRPARILSETVSVAAPRVIVRTVKTGALRVRVMLDGQPLMVRHRHRVGAGRHRVGLRVRRTAPDASDLVGRRATVEVTLVQHGNQPGVERVTASRRVLLTT